MAYKEEEEEHQAVEQGKMAAVEMEQDVDNLVDKEDTIESIILEKDNYLLKTNHKDNR